MSKRRRRRGGGPKAVRQDDESRSDVDVVEAEATDSATSQDEAHPAAASQPTSAEPDVDAEQDFGLWLRRQREIRDIDIRAIAEASKISVRYLEAMEENRFDLLPASVFTKGFLRQYALYVGLDPEEVVNFYLDARNREVVEAEIDPEPPVRRRSRSRADNLRWVVALLILIVIAAVAFGVRWFLSDRAAEDAVTEPPVATATSEPLTAPAAAVVDETPTAAETVSDDAEVAEPAPPSEPMPPLWLTLDFSAECWVEADVDGRRQTAEMFIQGSSLRLEAEAAIDLKVGDVRSVRFEVNGMPFEPEPVVAETAVRRLRFDLDTVARLRGEQSETAPVGVQPGEE